MASAHHSRENEPAQTEYLARPTYVEVAGRACGTCTLCCKVAAVEEFSKPNGAWCHHCAKGQRCTVYDQRPPSCRSFYCQWMLQPNLGSEWKPERAKFALVRTESGRRSPPWLIPVSHPLGDALPITRHFKQWAAQAAERFPEVYLVDVLIGLRSIVVLPDGEVELGVLNSDDRIHLEYKNTVAGRVIEVSKVKHMASAA